MERQILHIDVNSFAVSVERVVNAQLRNRPVIVAYPEMDRSVVLSLSLEARQAGIYRGMLLRQALRQCRQVTVIPPNEPLYSRAMVAILKIMSRFTPLIEPATYGRAYLDMTGTSRLFGLPQDVAFKIQRAICSTVYLPTSLGIASNKLVSKIASAVIAPGGIEQVPHGTEQTFMAPLKVFHLPAIDQPVKKQLLELNIQFIGEIAELSLSHLTLVFGRTGWKLFQAARGIDYTPVFPPQQFPNIYEQQTLAEDTNDIFLLRAALYRLIEKVGSQLRQSCQTARRVIVEIYYADHREAAGQTRLPIATNLDRELFFTVDQLLKKILTRRIRVRKLAVRYFDLRPVTGQLSLFDKPKSGNTNKNLNRAMDKIRQRFGENAVKFALANSENRDLEQESQSHAKMENFQQMEKPKFQN